MSEQTTLIEFIEPAAKNQETLGSNSIRHKPITFKSYIHTILKQAPWSGAKGYNMAGIVCEQLDTTLKIFTDRISEQARILTRDNKHQTVTVKEISTCLELLFPRGFSSVALKKCEEAVEKYSNTFYDKNSDQTRSKSSRAGINIPPHICEKYLRQHNATALSVSETAPVFLAAFLEELINKILSKACEQASLNKRKTVNIRHLVIAYQADNELCTIFNNFNIQILGGGVLPRIHDSLIPDAEKKKRLANKRRRARENNAEITHKAMPGTKSLKKIKALQKTTELLIKRERFRRFIKQQITILYGDIPNFASNVLNTIQYYVEEKTINMLINSLDLMVHAKRTTLKDKDILLCLNHHYKYDENPNYEVKGFEDLVDDSIRRLAARAGTKTIEKSCLSLIREFILRRCLDIIVPSLALIKYHVIKTLTLDVVRRAASVKGVNIPVESKIRRKKKNSSSQDSDESDADDQDDQDEEESNQVQMVETTND